MSVDGEDFVERPKRTRGPRNLNVGPGGTAQAGAAPKQTEPIRKRSLKNEIEKALFYVNLGFLFLPPAFHQDALDPAEIEALATALNNQAQANNRVYKLMESALSGGATGNLMVVAAIIMSRRLARHGVIPAQFDQAGGQLLTVDPEALANFIVEAETDAAGNITSTELPN